MKQTDQVLEYLQKNGSIDPLRAFNELGILRNAGIAVTGETKTNPDTGKHWKEYRLG